MLNPLCHVRSKICRIKTKREVEREEFGRLEPEFVNMEMELMKKS